MRHEQWLAQFADRNEERAAISEFLGDLAGRYSTPRFPIVQFYGVSGQGKTSLFYKTALEAPHRYPNISFACVDLADLNSSRIDKPVDVLWSITNAVADGGILCPLSLCLYAHYWKKQNPREDFRLQESALKDYVDRCIRGCEILSPFADLVHTLADIGQAAFKVLAVLDRCWKLARERVHELRISDLRRDEPGTWTLDRIEGSFPEFLALDILTYLKANRDRKVCLMLDTFERLEPGAKGDGCERLFQDLCSRLLNPRDKTGERSSELRGRTGILLFGRERLRWEHYDSADPSDPWSKHIEYRHLAGFTKPDAQAFLRHDFAEFWRARNLPGVADQLKTHEEAILAASDEREDGDSSYLPYYLRLAGEMIHEQGPAFRPEMLGCSPVEMQQRFVKYLRERSPEKLRAVQTLALALFFDDDLFNHLVRTNHIQGIPVHCMVPELLRNRSYVRQFEYSGHASYRFHRHMQQSLLDDLDQSPERVETSRPAIEAILEYYAARAAFDWAADFKLAIHLTAYEHGTDVLLTHVAAGRIPPWFLAYWLDRFESSFDYQTATWARARMIERALAICEKALGPDHPDVADSLNKLAMLYHAQGRYEEAMPLYQRALSIREKALGPDHPETATGLNNLALLFNDQGHYEEAMTLNQRALAIREKALGPDHPDTADSLNSLAMLYHAQGRYEDAVPLNQRALAIREKALGPDHPETAHSLNNVATLYHDQGRDEEAVPLYQRALAISEKALGPDHPDTANSLNSLAHTYHAQGHYEEAMPLHQRALAIREKALGPDHPDTATTLNNLALLYHAEGRYEEAVPLLRRALAILEKALGPDHPDTATPLNNLAVLLRDQGANEGSNAPT